MTCKKIKAFSIIEVLISVSMLAIILAGGIQVFTAAITTVNHSQDFIYAELLARDLIELTISKRNEDWNSLSPGQYYFTEDAVAGFLFTPGTEAVNGFTRYVTLSQVERDGSGNIVASGGTVDPDMVKATATVEWTYQLRNFEVETVQYLSNWRRF